MSTTYTANDLLNALAAASKTLSERKEEINRLNVFPVPDGDTGTNMSLTLETVVENLARLPIGADGAEIRKAITTGALMGARGNSGVITSQILRGLCEGSVGAEALDAVSIDAAFSQAVDVAFQAVRKPVEGTILTVLRDSAAAAKRARKKKLETDEALAAVVTEAYASVQRTPDLLPVLKENGVVDAGGYGLAIFFDAFTAALTGKEGPLGDELAFARGAAPKVEIEQINDWEGSAYRYCTEFLVHSDTLDVDAAKDFLTTMGDCDLLVGMHPNFKVHVHSNRSDKVLGWFLDHDAQVSEVHIHNMQLQSAARNDALAAEKTAERKPLGFVAVAAGEGNAKILASLGVDEVVSGGQTMNPSTKDLLDAVGRVNADAVVILPNNSNIIMAAQTACGLSETPVPWCHEERAAGVRRPVRRRRGRQPGRERREHDGGLRRGEDRRGHARHQGRQGRGGQRHPCRRRHRHRRRLHRRGGPETRDLVYGPAGSHGRTGRRHADHPRRRGHGRRVLRGAGRPHRGGLRGPGSGRPPRRAAFVPGRFVGGIIMVPPFYDRRNGSTLRGVEAAQLTLQAFRDVPRYVAKSLHASCTRLHAPRCPCERPVRRQ